MKNKNDFEFSYVAPSSEERKEIESIRNSYITNSKPNDKLSQLRKLDNRVKNTPTIISLICGIVGILIFGLGLAMILEWQITIWGIMVSAIGLIITLIAYPINNKIAKSLKAKYSEEIIKLSDELLNDEK